MARRRSGKKIDFTHWTGFQFNVLALGTGTSAGTLASAAHEPDTLMRTRGEWFVSTDGVLTPPLGAIITIGFILVPEGTGTTVLWSPFNDADAPWLYWDTMFLGYEETVIDNIDVPGLTSGRRVIDSRAMRIRRNQEVQAVIENTVAPTALAINANVNGRFLSGS